MQNFKMHPKATILQKKRTNNGICLHMSFFFRTFAPKFVSERTNVMINH